MGGCWVSNHSVLFACVCRNQGVTWSLAPSSRKMSAWCVEARIPPAFITTVCTGVTAWISVSTDSNTSDVHINLRFSVHEQEVVMVLGKYLVVDKIHLLLYGGFKGPNSETCHCFRLSMIETILNIHSLGSFPRNPYPKLFLQDSDWVFMGHMYCMHKNTHLHTDHTQTTTQGTDNLDFDTFRPLK